jgi:hypothetical protein
METPPSGPSPRVSLRKRLGFTSVFTLALLAVCEALAQAYYLSRAGEWLWTSPPSDTVFHIRAFTEAVDDERIITLRKNHMGEYRTDRNRFRTGLNEYEGKSGVVVLLGDSVPFGWGLPDEQTVPSRLARFFDDNGHSGTGVINAAIPSYSLMQAVKRYEREIAGKFPVKAVVLHAIDPAAQVALHGSQWSPDLNWARNEQHTGPHPGPRLIWVFRHSALAFYAYLSWEEVSVSRSPLDPEDRETKSHFLGHVAQTLDELHNVLAPSKIPLLVVAANPARASIGDGRTPFAIAVQWMNQSLREYAQSTPGVYFVEIVGQFESSGEENLFLDTCCHLSAKGAELEARILFRELERGGVLR